MELKAPYGFWLLNVNDISNWEGFCSKLSREGSSANASPGRRIWQLLPDEVRSLLSNGANDEAQLKRIVEALNSILGRSDFYEREVFTGVKVSVEAKTLLSGAINNLQPERVLRLNRLLIEASYPEYVAKTHQWLEPNRGLRRLADIIGINPEYLQAGEGPDILSYYNEGFLAAQAQNLSLDLLEDLVESYGTALNLSLLIGSNPLLTLENINQQSLDSLKGIPVLTLDLKLDKRQLLEIWGGQDSKWKAPGLVASIKLFLFPEAVPRAFEDSLDKLEAGLMSESKGDRKLIILVPAHSIELDGEYLAIVGGDYLEHWRKLLPDSAPGSERVDEVFKDASDNLKWVRLNINHLTPLQIKVARVPTQNGSPNPTPDLQDPIACAVYAQLFACCILYMARQTIRIDPNENIKRQGVNKNEKQDAKNKDVIWKSTFVGEKFLAEIEVGNTSKLIEVITSSNAQDPWTSVEILSDLASAWIYSGVRGASDRLFVLQREVAQILQGTDPATNCRILLNQAQIIKKNAEWALDTFIENKLDTFFDRVREVEGAVDATVKSFNEQVQALTKTLVDNMLAAVGVVVASFIAAVFKRPFDERVFQAGTSLYTLYLLIFPFAIGLRSTRERYKNTIAEFNKQQEAFYKRLTEKKVNDIVGDTVTSRGNWFNKWFWIAFGVYVSVSIILSIAIFNVPKLISRWEKDFTVTEAAFTSPTSKTAQLIIYGTRFQKEKEIVVSVGQAKFTNINSQSLIVHSDQVLVLSPKYRDMIGVKEVQIKQDKVPKTIPLPALPPIPQPHVDSWGKVLVGHTTIEARGSNFDSIAEVKFGNQVLQHTISQEGTAMKLTVFEPLTSRPGNKEIVFVLNDGSRVNSELTVGPK